MIRLHNLRYAKVCWNIDRVPLGLVYFSLALDALNRNNKANQPAFRFVSFRFV